MVSHDHAAALSACGLLPLDLDAYVEYAEQFPVPGLFDPALPVPIEMRVNDRQQYPVSKVQGEANTPDNAAKFS
jgi:hypothetical protein